MSLKSDQSLCARARVNVGKELVLYCIVFYCITYIYLHYFVYYASNYAVIRMKKKTNNQRSNYKLENKQTLNKEEEKTTRYEKTSSLLSITSLCKLVTLNCKLYF